MDTDIERMVMWFLIMVVAITIHGFAHTRCSADLLGDSTPRKQGRISVNPVDHLDPLGTALYGHQRHQERRLCTGANR